MQAIHFPGDQGTELVASSSQKVFFNEMEDKVSVKDNYLSINDTKINLKEITDGKQRFGDYLIIRRGTKWEIHADSGVVIHMEETRDGYRYTDPMRSRGFNRISGPVDGQARVIQPGGDIQARDIHWD